MHDIKFIRENQGEFEKKLAGRGYDNLDAAELVSDLIDLDNQRRAAIQTAEKARAQHKENSRQIGQAKGLAREILGEEFMSRAADAKDYMESVDISAGEAITDLDNMLEGIPNIPLDGVPVGEDETANIEIRKNGEVSRPKNPKQHFEIGEALGQMDFETAAQISGARFVILQGKLAQLERALGQFMLDLHTQEHGYTEVVPPLLVRDSAVFGVGQLPKFEEDLFKTTSDHYLTSTAEVTLTNLVRERITPAEKLPLRYTALTPCFRSEAGSAGRDTRGMIRLHQFNKVELVSIVDAEQGEAELEKLLSCAEKVLQELKLPYRVMLLSTGDMGFSARKTYDLEVWLAGQGAYREISSCSYCGDFQARRMNARYRHSGEKQTKFVHTLNGSGLAVGRTLVAVLEHYQQEDGSVQIPEVLQKYMNGEKIITAEELEKN